jgi:hypothetical protein
MLLEVDFVKGPRSILSSGEYHSLKFCLPYISLSIDMVFIVDHKARFEVLICAGKEKNSVDSCAAILLRARISEGPIFIANKINYQGKTYGDYLTDFRNQTDIVN